MGVSNRHGGPEMAPKPPTFVAPGKAVGSRYRLERETGFEPATPSLEGWRSTAELFPRLVSVLVTPSKVVGRGGLEPPKAFASRFTVCPLWPLGYLPENRGMRSKTLADLVEKAGAGGRTRTP